MRGDVVGRWALAGLMLMGCRTRLLDAEIDAVEPRVCRPGAAATIALGDDFTCAITSGEVRCWGRNTQGQVGDGTLEPRASPTPTGLSRAVAIASGPAFDVGGGTRMGHTCAALTDGTVSCWGSNIEGEGDPNRAHASPRPTPIAGLRGATQVAVGGYHQCARLDDGTVACWGNPYHGALGNGTSGSERTLGPVAVRGLAGVRQVAVGHQHSCALREDGTVWCWGGGELGQLGNDGLGGSPTPVRVSGLDDAVAITSAWFRTCALRADRTVACWGADIDDEGLFHVGAGARAAPVSLAKFEDVERLAISALGGYAAHCDGTVSSWVLQYGPLRVPSANGATEVQAGNSGECYRDGAGGVWCWGSGLVGDGTSEGKAVPVKVL